MLIFSKIFNIWYNFLNYFQVVKNCNNIFLFWGSKKFLQLYINEITFVLVLNKIFMKGLSFLKQIFWVTDRLYFQGPQIF